MSTPLALNATELEFGRRGYASPHSTKPNHPPTLTPTQLVISPSNLSHPGGEPVNKLIYAGFLEHLGRCIYGGIVDDPKHPSDKKLLIEQERGRLGIRKDVVDVIGAEGELGVPMLRWPGGNYVSNYHWQDGIGPVENRPRRIELAWLSDESNIFGTDEFIDYCRVTKCEPYICLNMGTGTYEEALAWVEYCNGTGNTHWANLRRKNTGRDEPHNVKYWGLGNEVWGPWQVGNQRAADYAEKARQWAHGLKLVDPTIKLVSCGHEGNGEWDSKVLQVLAGSVDLHSIHLYTTLGQEKTPSVQGLEYENNVFGPAAAERNIEICKSLIDLAQINRVNFGLPAKPLKIAFDEWNVWDEVKADAKNGLAQVYDYTDMLGFIAWLNVLVRKHQDLGLACLAQSVNVISPLTTSPDGLLRQTTFYPLKLFSKFMRDGHLLNLPSVSEHYTGPTFPVWIQHAGLKPAYIDLVAMITPDQKSIRLSILNRHPTADWALDLRLDGFEASSVEVHEMYSDDLAASNTFERPETVVPKVKKISKDDLVKGKTIVRKHSWSFLIIEGKSS